MTKPSSINSFQEAVRFALASLGDRQRAEIRVMPSALHARAVLHFSFGLWLRNVLDMHHNKQLLQSIAEENPGECCLQLPGVVPTVEPDTASGIIITRVWELLREGTKASST